MDVDYVQQKVVKVKDTNAEYLLSLKASNECGFNKAELEAILKLFKKYDGQKQGSVAFYDMMDMLHDYGFIVNQQCKEKIFKDLEDRNTNKLDFQTTLFVFRVAHEHEKFIKRQEEENMTSEYIDAFVALGGNPDGTGSVRKDSILDILSKEFDLIFDMDDLLERIEVSTDDIDFSSFRKLFKVSDDPKSLSKASSVLSLLSQRSRKSIKTTSSVETVKVRMRDFEKYLLRLEQEERERELDSHSISNTISPKK